MPRQSIVDLEDFGRRSVSVEVRSDGTAVAVIPHGPYRAAPDEPSSGPVIEESVRREARLTSIPLGSVRWCSSWPRRYACRWQPDSEAMRVIYCREPAREQGRCGGEVSPK